MKSNLYVKGDWLSILSILLLVVGGSLFTYYMVIEEFNSCTSNPINYAAEKLTENYSYNYAEVYFYYDKNNIVADEIVKINLNDSNDLPFSRNYSNKTYFE